jgi:hypothetical protein
VERTGSLASTSSDPRFFRVPAFRLTAGRAYNLTAVVTDNLGQQANASVAVLVTKAALVVRAEGAGTRVIWCQPHSCDSGGPWMVCEFEAGGNPELGSVTHWDLICGRLAYPGKLPITR